MPITLDDLRRFAVARSLFPPTTLKRALERMGFVQADPIRAPARAQDLTLRHRVRDYRSGDLERRYSELGLEEDFFLNYGFVTRALQALMHPRSETGVPADAPRPWPGGAPEEGAAPAGVRAPARCRASARGRRPFLARVRSRTIGAVPPTPRPICWTPCITAAGCGWRGARAAYASTPPTSTGPGRPRGRPARAARRTRRCRRPHLCAVARSEPVDLRATAALCGAAVARRAERTPCSAPRSGSRMRASTASTGIGRLARIPLAVHGRTSCAC